nr:MAG TPA: hypothetical protein [Caudoviricetes sp.]
MVGHLKKTNTLEPLKKGKECVVNTTEKHFIQALVEVVITTKMMERRHT